MSSLKLWNRLKPVKEQLRFVKSNKRFRIVAAGRRSGKSERARRMLIKNALRYPGNYFIAAPTRDQCRRIHWEKIKLMTFPEIHAKRPSESELKVFLANGSSISLLSLDRPDRIEGSDWHGGILDELASAKKNIWAENIRPALDTLFVDGYQAFCYLVGTPEGLDNDFYDLYDYAVNYSDEEWAAFTWKSSEVLPPSVIEAAKRSLSAKQFRQEYEASFETASGRIYEDYGPANLTNQDIDPEKPLYWTHDQNFTPLSSAICQIEDGVVNILSEIVLTSAVARQSAEEFVEKFRNHQHKRVFIYGDPAGRVGEKHGHVSDYKAIEEVLKQNGWLFQRRVKNSAPSIKDRQNAVRAKIRNAMGEVSLFVNPQKAPWSHKGLATVQLKEGSSFQEDDRNKYQHITTAIGYMIDYEWPVSNIDFTTQVLRL